MTRTKGRQRSRGRNGRAWPRGAGLLLALAAPACHGGGGDELTQAIREERLEGTSARAVGLPSAEARGIVAPAAAEPREIYYDLTRYAWYREGRPLLYEGRAYTPEGRPEPTGERRLRRLGEYEGVAFYVEAEEPRPYEVLYVPVFREYWQPFSAEPAPARTAD